jgi:hypothetical protein
MNKPITLVHVTTYGSVNIGVNTSNGKFYANIATGLIESTSLLGIKKQIDTKSSPTFKSFKALRRSGYSPDTYLFTEVKIVSIEVKGGRKMWVDDKGRKFRDDLYDDTTENRVLLVDEAEQERQHKQERDALNDAQDVKERALVAKYTRIDVDKYGLEGA